MSASKKTIVIVDDEKSNLVRARMLLEEEEDLNPVLLNSGMQCIKYFETKTADLILLDIMMPDMDGWAVISLLQSNPKTEHIPVIFLTADSSPETEAACFGAGGVDYAVKPMQPASVISRIRRAIELNEYRTDLAAKVKEQMDYIDKIKYDFILGMANLVEGRDESTGEHVKRTAAVVKAIGEEAMRRGLYSDVLTEEYLNYMYNAAPLHDIGKIKISDIILLKPGKLTDEEFELIKKHTTYGREIISDILKNIEDKEFLKILMEIAEFHHEKWNGKGYPKHLIEEEIPLCARIMAIADVYDALKEKRCYKDAFPLEEVYEILEEDSGIHFDPQLIECFMAIKDDIKDL